MMNRKAMSAVVGMLALAACSSARPVLYPNAHLQTVGKEAAEHGFGSRDSSLVKTLCTFWTQSWAAGSALGRVHH